MWPTCVDLSCAVEMCSFEPQGNAPQVDVDTGGANTKAEFCDRDKTRSVIDKYERFRKAVASMGLERAWDMAPLLRVSGCAICLLGYLCKSSHHPLSSSALLLGRLLPSRRIFFNRTCCSLHLKCHALDAKLWMTGVGKPHCLQLKKNACVLQCAGSQIQSDPVRPRSADGSVLTSPPRLKSDIRTACRDMSWWPSFICPRDQKSVDK